MAPAGIADRVEPLGARERRRRHRRSLLAGYALVNDATVLTSDRDFDHIASVTALRHEYLAPSPRGA